jgi:hypothetical protein
METIEFKLRKEVFYVQSVMARQVCDVLARDPQMLRWVVRSTVSSAVFRVFLSAIEGNAVEVTNENVDGLWTLSDEFQFWSLLWRVRAFKETPTYQIGRQNECIDGLEKRLQEFSQHIETHEASLKAAVVRLSQVEAELKRQSQAQESTSASLRAALALKGDVQRLAANVSAFQNWEQWVLRAHEGLERAMASATTYVGRLSSDFQDVRGRQNDLIEAVERLRSAVGTFNCTASCWTQFDSRIIFGSTIFSEFSGKRFSLLWRGSRDGFRARDFHRFCDRHANTLTLIEDTHGNIFGGFTPLEWDSCGWWKADARLKTFIFTLKNPHNLPARKFALKAEKKDQAICCDSRYGPMFGGLCRDVVVCDNCNANTQSNTWLGQSYINDTRLGVAVFTNSTCFQVKEIEVFKITN